MTFLNEKDGEFRIPPEAPLKLSPFCIRDKDGASVASNTERVDFVADPSQSA